MKVVAAAAGPYVQPTALPKVPWLGAAGAVSCGSHGQALLTWFHVPLGLPCLQESCGEAAHGFTVRGSKGSMFSRCKYLGRLSRPWWDIVAVESLHIWKSLCRRGGSPRGTLEVLGRGWSCAQVLLEGPKAPAGLKPTSSSYL